jgi:hypothetical protein
MRWLLPLPLIAVSAACVVDGAEEKDELTCALGELTGTWRIQYQEVNGDCGAIPDETSVFDPGTGSGCTRDTRTISADKCRLDTSFSCPTADRLGTSAWGLVVRQTSETRLDGTGTVQVSHSTLGTCRSTYTITVTRL